MAPDPTFCNPVRCQEHVTRVDPWPARQIVASDPRIGGHAFATLASTEVFRCWFHDVDWLNPHLTRGADWLVIAKRLRAEAAGQVVIRPHVLV